MLLHNEYLNLKQIAESGQCFRMNQIAENRYGLVAYGTYLELMQLNYDTIELNCNEEDYHRIWEDYFDIEFNYGRIVKNLLEGEDTFLREAARYGKGIRILKQEPFEAMISFIISQNKNIPAIKNCIEAICKKYGEKKISDECGGVEYYTFPDPKILVNAKKEDLRALKTGYRDEYIIRAAEAIEEGTIDFNSLKVCSFEEAVKSLKTIHGVGEKVANCIALYGLHHIEGFPVDVWIKRVLNEIYNQNFDKSKYSGYAGIVQQYMFYYMRHMKGVA